jgi:hypothetical protein
MARSVRVDDRGSLGGAALVLALGACAEPGGRPGSAWDETTSATADPDDDGGTAGPLPGTGTDALDDDGAPNPDDTAGLDDDGDESSGGFDCTPWTTTWIGAPCMQDGDCAYEGGTCLREDEGFPCGTCSQPCDMLCPDLEGVPETFCIDGGDVGVEATGHCLSKCAPDLLGGDGCRDGYDCAALPRYMDAGTTAGVCVPQGMWDPMSACQQELLDRGVAFVPTTHEIDHPEGHPELDCIIIDPVLLYSPVLGVALTDGNGDMNPVLVACETAVRIADTAEIAAQMEPLGATEIIHYGTYNCRVIAGTSTLSNHAEGRAIDLGGFVAEDGTLYSVYSHWEDGVANPTTTAGQWLRGFTDTLWAMMTWNIILTPEYNADHDDHFHVDLTPGSSFYE